MQNDQAPASDESLITSAQPAAADGTQGESLLPAQDENAWLPEKFRVIGEDGKLDEAASSRKLADSYRALESHKGEIPLVPESPDGYVIDQVLGPDGSPLDKAVIDEFLADPLYKEFAKEAHAANFTNEQLKFAISKYINATADVIREDVKMSLSDAKAELQKLWPDESEMQRNLAGVVKAINGFGGGDDNAPGAASRLMQKYGRDPDFIAFAARVSAEMNEDLPPAQTGGLPSTDIEALQKSAAYWDANHPEHSSTVAKVNAFYAKQFGTAVRR